MSELMMLHPMVQKHPWMRLVPNGITGARIGLSGVVTYMIFVPDVSLVALLVFVLGASSDRVDGWFARKYRVQSAVGAQLDSLADKVLVGSYMVFLWPLFGWEEVLLCTIILVREILVLSFYHWRKPMNGKSLDEFASKRGKQKMVLQVVALALYGAIPVLMPSLIASMTGRYCYELLSFAVLFAATGMTIWSGIDYWFLWRGARR